MHPGILHTRADLDRIRANVMARQYPWYGAFLAFEADPRSSSGYLAAPVAAIAGSYPRVRADAHAAYQNAIMWYVTRDPANANAALTIVDSWARTCASWICTDNIDAYTSVLHFAAAAEILRYTAGSGWTEAHTARFVSFLENVMWPVVEGTFLGSGVNGCSSIPGDGNQGAGDMRGMMAIAIFLDDRAKFEAAVTAFEGAAGTPNPCTALGKEAGGYVDANGCAGEAGRDQAHPQGGVASYAEMAQMAWCQGLDLWAYGSNRIASALEWFAKYNMGDPNVPFTNTRTCYSSYGALSTIARGQWTMTYEIAFNHYVYLKGLPMALTQQLLEQRLRPEGTATDDPGFGTLLFSLRGDTAPPTYGGEFKIVNLDSGKALQTVGATIVQGTNIEQSTWTGTNQQRWSLIPLGSEYYNITNGAAPSALVVDSGSAPSSAGTPVHMWTSDGSDNKIWKIVPDPAAGARFVSRDTILMSIPVARLAWDIAGGATVDGARLQMSADGATPSQRFVLSRAATPPNPGGVSVAAGNGQVTVLWAPAPTAQGYLIKRALTSGGPYSLLAGPVTTTSYTDTTVSSGMTYYYVVSATNPSGESANSAEISAHL